jgi:hypothetical protein
MIRGTHAKKKIEDALAYAEASGWRIRSGGKGHAWGENVLPVQRLGMPLRRVLHHQCLEYA